MPESFLTIAETAQLLRVSETSVYRLFVNREVIRAKADEAGHGTKRLPTDILHSLSLALPQRQEQERLARVEVNAAESRTLAALLDALLPKLISGELRVPEAEAIVEEAV
jgi:type I restriction enzyme, S subunit